MNIIRQFLSKKTQKREFKVTARCRVGGFTSNFLIIMAKVPQCLKVVAFSPVTL